MILVMAANKSLERMAPLHSSPLGNKRPPKVAAENETAGYTRARQACHQELAPPHDTLDLCLPQPQAKANDREVADDDGAARRNALGGEYGLTEDAVVEDGLDAGEFGEFKNAWAAVPLSLDVHTQEC
jgi:hypothetical protein